jgi:hypothetical protein
MRVTVRRPYVMAAVVSVAVVTTALLIVREDRANPTVRLPGDHADMGTTVVPKYLRNDGATAGQAEESMAEPPPPFEAVSEPTVQASVPAYRTSSAPTKAGVEDLSTDGHSTPSSTDADARLKSRQPSKEMNGSVTESPFEDNLPDSGTGGGPDPAVPAATAIREDRTAIEKRIDAALAEGRHLAEEAAAERRQSSDLSGHQERRSREDKTQTRDEPRTVEPPRVRAAQTPPTITPPASDTPSRTSPTASAHQLVARLENAYERGDANALAALFAKDARTNEGTGRSLIRSLYARFFRRSVSSRLTVHDLRWQVAAGGRLVGRGRIAVSNRYQGSRSWRHSNGSIQLELADEAGTYRITQMFYQLD